MALTLFPTPDAEGIARTKEIVFNKCGKSISDEEAAQLLGGLMRYLYLLRYLEEKYQDQKFHDPQVQ